MITVVGLGPSGLARVPAPIRAFLLDAEVEVVCRTVRHPAAEELADLRPVTFCDDLYDAAETFEDVYAAIVERVRSAAADGDVIYAVPGSPRVGEFAVRLLEESDVDVTVLPGESFIDAVLDIIGYDPLDRGLQILNGHDLIDPVVLDKPTIIGHLDRPEILADVAAQLGRVLAEGAQVTVVVDVGGESQSLMTSLPEEVDPGQAGLRTSLFVDAEPGGLIGAVHTMRTLREECPWDREQTHATLVKNLIEETYELVDAIAEVDRSDGDLVAVAAMEDELGDVLLQVLFHAAIARESGSFDIDDVAEVLRQKLVRRHPHVFADVDANSASEVKQNWDEIKQAERGPATDPSAIAGIPTGLPALQRASKVSNKAAKVGFDWEDPAQVLLKTEEELSELNDAIAGSGDIPSELGDLLFSVVNVARHLGLDPELALADATSKFERRFRTMEKAGPIEGLSDAELERRWTEAKRSV